MNSKILLLAFSAAFLTSCTTSYKTGQTPDDVYYSPVRPEGEEDQAKNKEDKKREDKKYRNNDDEYYEDSYLRMKVRNRNRWSEIDDPYYYSRRYNYSTYNCCCFGNPWSPSSYWNNYYNPYYQSSVIINPKTSYTYKAPRTFNLNTYNSNALTNNNYTNPKVSGSSNGSSNNSYKAPRNTTNTRREDNPGNVLRDLFQSSNNSSSNSSNSNNSSSGTKTSSSSGSSSSGSSSSNSSSAPVRKF